MAKHVIVRGQVFRWEEKAPFGASGKSVHGALEYSLESEALRCHECGCWFKSLGNHVSLHGGMTAREYRIRHGLRVSESIIVPSLAGVRRKRAIVMSANRVLGQFFTDQKAAKENAIKRSPSRGNPGLRNERRTCPVQLPSRIRAAAIHFGHTPTGAEANEFDRGLYNASQVHYGTWANACWIAGCEPNTAAPRKKYSASLLAETLRDFYVLNRRTPRRSEWGTGRLATQQTYIRYFESIKAAYAAVGLGLVAERVA